MVGRAARIRVSSVMCCRESNGTLKSTRTKTRFPVRSISRIVFLFMFFPHIKKGSLKSDDPSILPALLIDKIGEVSNTAGVAPLVIVPCDDLDQVTAGNHCRKPVNNRGMRITTKVHRNKWLIGIVEDTLERASSSLLKGVVNGFLGGLFAQSCYKIDY